MFGNCFFEIPSLTCLGRCEVHSERFQIETLCYCDSICLQIGDCCHDYRKVCKAKLSEKPQVKQVCSNHYIVTNSCPKGTDQYLDGLCSETHGEILRRPYDLLRNLHVFDHDKNISYRNVFCARCNGARNTSYWTTTADCSTTANLSSIKDNLLSFVRNNCTILMGMPKTSGIIEGRLCKERHHAFTYSYGHNKVKECRKYCERYSLPVVVLDLNRFSCTIYKNPHCALLQAVRIDKLSCRRCPFGAHPHIPDLRILFNFQSTGTQIDYLSSSSSITTTKLARPSCETSQVYDPFRGVCRVVYSPDKLTDHHGNSNNSSAFHTPSFVHHRHDNCTHVTYNKTNITIYGNSTLKLNDLGVLLSNASYFVSGDVIVVCIQSEGQAGGSEGLHRSGDRVVLGIMTCIGCSISVLALLVLLVIYARFPELRNLPGKIQMNLSVALLAFHVLFFMVAMSTSGALCKAIAIGIHYFLLVGFAWMAVMAYDVHRTFTGQTEAILQPQRSMLVYSCLSWLLPAAFVGAIVVIDLTVPGAIDYGKGEFCYITSRFGLIFAFLVPVSLVLSWNILSLARTLFYIRLAR
ncbi:uncharacterized protein LOC5509002 [Nematostella vectensis]|uniref:uncharacterized protein LOC5509002 n=1 Tax=Nematostella vectensis TaxID=45351 RepID=UPI0020770931|nr:uncharacterized protein LOC5509002 [Nematostella vectensis]